MKFHRISWIELEKQCLELAIKTKNLKFDRIICISRGGLVWARVLSDLLSIPVSHLTVATYADLKQVKTPIVTESPKKLPDKEVWLVVDEICDTGKTFQAVKKYLNKSHSKRIYTLAPIIKPHSEFVPDYWVKNIDAWVIFPYEIKETYQAFIKIYGTKEKAKKKLIDQGIKDWQIDSII